MTFSKAVMRQCQVDDDLESLTINQSYIVTAGDEDEFLDAVDAQLPRFGAAHPTTPDLVVSSLEGRRILDSNLWEATITWTRAKRIRIRDWMYYSC